MYLRRCWRKLDKWPKTMAWENVVFQAADAYDLPFEDEKFDVIHTHQAVCHFHDHVRAIKENAAGSAQGRCSVHAGS